MAGTLTASAATPACGSSCANIYSQKWGPKYLLDIWPGKAAAGAPVILFQRSNSDPAEDFVVRDFGTVRGFYTHYHLVTPQFAHVYHKNVGDTVTLLLATPPLLFGSALATADTDH